jgi:hypothetical protein
MSDKLPTTQELLTKVGDLIDKGTYRKIIGQLNDSTCNGRCYLGLVVEVLVQKGFCEWQEGTRNTVEITPKGEAAGVTDDHMKCLDFRFLGLPNRIKNLTGKQTPIWKLNDDYNTEFKDIHQQVLEHIQTQNDTQP